MKSDEQKKREERAQARRDQATGDVDAFHIRVMSDPKVVAALDRTRSRRQRARIIAGAIWGQTVIGKMPVWWDEVVC